MVEFRLNGKSVRSDAAEDEPLLQVLRNDLGMNGPKFGCGLGQCGACTVLVAGLSTRSCILPLGAVAGRDVTTLDGLAVGNRLHPVQEAFLEVQAAQCGYCTNGMIMRTVELLTHSPRASESEIREAFAGHLCRCGTHARILRAVKLAQSRIGGQANVR